MVISTKQTGGCLEIILGHHFNQDDIIPFRTLYRDMPDSIKTITVNFANTRSISSSGIGILLNMHQEVSSHIQVTLTNCSDRIISLLEHCEMMQFFTLNQKSNHQSLPDVAVA